MKIRKFTAAVIAAAIMTLYPAAVICFSMTAYAAESEEPDYDFDYDIDYGTEKTVVTLTPSQSGSRLRYTTDGSTPNKKSKAYEKALKFRSAKTLKVVEYSKSGKQLSDVVTINVKLACSPAEITAVPDGKGGVRVKLSTKTKGAVIYYTTNGSAPKAGASKTKKYTGEFTVTAGKTVKATVTKRGFVKSGVASLDTDDIEDKSGKTRSVRDPMTDEILSLVNSERKEHSLYSLKLSKRLCEAANARAEEIAENYSIGHFRPDGRDWSSVLDECGYTYKYAAENLGYIGGGRYTDDNAAGYIMDMWKNSPPHYASILNDVGNHIGIGHVRVGNYYYFVQIFGLEK